MHVCNRFVLVLAGQEAEENVMCIKGEICLHHWKMSSVKLFNNFMIL